MIRPVSGPDNRRPPGQRGDTLHWTVRADLEWRPEARADDEFVLDVSEGHGPAVVMLVLVCVLAVVLIVWTPPDVVVPLWLVMIILLLLLFFPLRWALRRPWRVQAYWGDNSKGEPEEIWEGRVRGVFNVRQQVARTQRSIAEVGIPDPDGPLRLVSPIPDDANPAMEAPTPVKVKQDDDD